MTSYGPLQSVRLYEQIVTRIETEILNGKLHSGDRLPTERELADQFGVSRTVIREAVKTLREKGLVQSTQGRGTFITNRTAQSVRHSLGFMIRAGSPESTANLVQARAIIEPEIAALAAVNATQAQIAELRHAIARMDETLTDAEAFVEADLEFHLTLAHATQNTLIPVLLDPIMDLLREQRKSTFKHGGAAHGQTHHKKILEAVTRRNPNAARDAMRAHLRQVLKDSPPAHQTRHPHIHS